MLNRSAFAGESKCSICDTATAIYCCEECPGMHICENCNQFWHVKHPTRSHHTYSVMNHVEDSPTQQFNGSESDNCTSFDKESDWEVDWDSAFEGHHNVDDLCKIATLAEKFGLTSFKEYQKKVIDATLQGRDTIVVQPTFCDSRMALLR